MVNNSLDLYCIKGNYYKQSFLKEVLMKELVELYLAFLRIGAVNFGGGYAMLPLLQRDLEENRHWTTTDELMDYFAIGQCTPGIIALNVSTFIGHKKRGIPGALAATLGFLTMPIIIILIIAAFLQNFAELAVVQHAFAGIRVCVCVLIIQAVLRLWKKSVVDVKCLILYLIIFALTVFSKLLPVSVPAAVMVIAAGVFGVFFGKGGAKK
jgi:chromate transporter